MMKIRRNMILAIVITFCFTATLFMIIPIRSAKQYDPWLDYNDDGKINLVDLSYLASSYNTAGDPTKNVNVTNWPQPFMWVNASLTGLSYDLKDGQVNLTSNSFNQQQNCVNITCEGHSRISILLAFVDADIGLNSNVTVSVSNLLWSDRQVIPNPLCNETTAGSGGAIINISTYGGPIWVNTGISYKPYVTETKAPYCTLVFNAELSANVPSNWWVAFNYCVYFRDE
jgi:hypothetical protein